MFERNKFINIFVRKLGGLKAFFISIMEYPEMYLGMKSCRAFVNCKRYCYE